MKYFKKQRLDSLTNISKYLIDNGYKLLGQGTYSEAFGRDQDNYIIKLSNDKSWLTFMRMIKERKSKHFPKIGTFRKIPDFRSDSYLVFVEKLNHIPIKQWLEDPYLLGYQIFILKQDSAMPMPLRIYQHDRNIWNKFKMGQYYRKFIKDSKNQQLINDTNFILEMSERFGFVADLHGNNIMQRNDGTLVIQDPFTEDL